MAISAQFRRSLIELRKKEKWSQEEVAQKLGISHSGYQRIEQTGSTSSKMLNKIASLYGMDVPQLLTYGVAQKAGNIDMKKQNEVYRIPVGDSMAPRIENGDIVVLDPHPNFTDNSIYAVIAGDSEATLKTVKKTEGGFWCIPMNTKYDAMFVPEDMLIRLYKVVQIVKTIR